MRNYKGFTLVELLITIAIIGILSAIAFPPARDFIARHRLTAASRQLYADLQEARLAALTKRTNTPGVNSRGSGIRFDSDSSYVTFEFNDLDNDFTYDIGEELEAKTKALPFGITVHLDDTVNSPAGATKALLYDRRGWPRSGTTVNRTYYLSGGSGVLPSCVVVSPVRISEGCP